MLIYVYNNITARNKWKAFSWCARSPDLHLAAEKQDGTRAV